MEPTQPVEQERAPQPAPALGEVPAQVARIQTVARESWLKNNWRLPVAGLFLTYSGVKYFVWHGNPTLPLFAAAWFLQSQMFLNTIRPQNVQEQTDEVGQQIFNWLKNPKNQETLLGATGLAVAVAGYRTEGYAIMGLVLLQLFARHVVGRH